MGAEEVDKLLLLRPFSEFSERKFPSNLPLRGILANDTRIRTYGKGQFIVREGDYGNSAFFILNGRARVILDSLPQDMLGRSGNAKRGVLKSIAHAFHRAPYPETRPFSGRRNIQQQPGAAIFLQDVPRVLDGNRTAVIEEGELFGEIAALGRMPRVATIIAEDEGTVLLEIRWQGLRDFGRFAPEWHQHIEEKYRQHGLTSHLRATPLIDRVGIKEQEQIAEQTKFLRFGSFDWQREFKQRDKDSSPAERLKHEPVVHHQGDYLNGLYLILSGFVRVSEKYNYGERTISYLGKGQSFGLNELLHNAEQDAPIGAQHTLRAMGYVDILLIPTLLVEDHIIPTLSRRERRELVIVPSTTETAKKRATSEVGALATDMVEFLLEHRASNGTATMLIDLDRCTRCDDCVRACASTHDNNPRFIRHGAVMENIQITNACMHCIDPVCMLECPTGAIHREVGSGHILINDYTCIGCAMCANSCPYDNIQMVLIRDRRGRPQYPVQLDAEGNIAAVKNSEEPFWKATKCDLCADYIGGPACVRACPHDAIKRADMQDVPTLARWLQR